MDNKQVDAESISDEMKEALEHDHVIKSIRAMLEINGGFIFFRYLFKHLGVGELPEPGIRQDLLMEQLGLLRAGNEIFKVVCEANQTVAAQIFAQVQKERYDSLYKGE